MNAIRSIPPSLPPPPSQTSSHPSTSHLSLFPSSTSLLSPLRPSSSRSFYCDDTICFPLITSIIPFPSLLPSLSLPLSHSNHFSSHDQSVLLFLSFFVRSPHSLISLFTASIPFHYLFILHFPFPSFFHHLIIHGRDHIPSYVNSSFPFLSSFLRLFIFSWEFSHYLRTTIPFLSSISCSFLFPFC